MAQFNKNTHTYLDQAKTLFEVVMVADQYGNPVTSGNPSGTAVDAFGRMRISSPTTLFDNFNRYQLAEFFATANSATTSSYTYDANTSMVSLTVNTTSGAYVKRETKRVFAYQPGKSLLTLNTFVFNEPKAGLRQRVGYFSDTNGVFLEQSNTAISFVVRSNTTGSVVETNRASQSSWNIDKLDGTGPSLKTLDLTKAQIFWTDIEWLGVGSVRCGFIIDGQFIHCHSFHHANHVTGTYMTTGCLPVRYEIENIATTASSSTLKQICSTVISEGGYELRGKPRSVANTVMKDLTTSGTFYNLMSIRLKADRLDAIVVPKNIGLVGKGNNTRIHWKILSGTTITGGSWVSAESDSSVEYNSTGTLSGGTTLTEGFIGIEAQASQSASLDSGKFQFQLERNSFTSTPVVFTLAATGGGDGDDAIGAIMWDEIT